MRRIIKYILIFLVLIFIILNFFKQNQNIINDIIIFGLWANSERKSEYEINSETSIEIDLFTTTTNNIYKKIAPGSKGNFVIKFKRPLNSKFKIEINERTSKPQNLVFIMNNNKYKSLKEMENIINEEFKNNEKLTINWELKYYLDDIHDIQDSKDGKNAQRYLFEINAFIE